MISCYIVDDELSSIKLLQSFIERTPILHLLGFDTNAIEAAPKIALLNTKPNLLFLDIEMPGYNGMDFIELINKETKIVFITAYSNYGAAAFDKEALDFLLKPFPYERFMRTIRRYLSYAGNINTTIVNEDDNFFMKTGKKGILEKVSIDRLTFLEAAGHFCNLFFVDGEKRTIYKTLGQVEKELPKNFLRIQRSYVINMDKIRRVEGNAILLEGAMKTPLVCSPDYREGIKEYLNKRIL